MNLVICLPPLLTAVVFSFPVCSVRVTYLKYNYKNTPNTSPFVPCTSPSPESPQCLIHF